MVKTGITSKPLKGGSQMRHSHLEAVRGISAAMIVFTVSFLSLFSQDKETGIKPRDSIREIVEHTSSSARMLFTPSRKMSALECLSQNIYYEARGETTEGKIAVGIVTLNRAQEKNFGNSVCNVVNQRIEYTRKSTVTQIKTINTDGNVNYDVKTINRIKKQVVCQFSWRCRDNLPKPKSKDKNWQESQEIAQQLLAGSITTEEQLSEALYFHSAKVRPQWAKGKQQVKRIGGHIFYSE
jgi:spore germination cell wall hydrolase CwlJ-like protein